MFVLSNIDCIEGFKGIQDNSIDLILTSPPYNVGIEYDTYKDDVSWDEYYDWCKVWLKESFRVLKGDGRMALNHYLSLGDSKRREAPLMTLNSIGQNIGFKHHSVIVWQDRTLAKATAWGSWLSASAPYINSPFEGVLLLYKHRWKKDKKGKSDIDKETFKQMTRGILTVKPETKPYTPAAFSVDFALKFIRLLSYEGDIVLDPFMGGGSTAVACKISNRRFVGFEISEKYWEIAVKRVSSYG